MMFNNAMPSLADIAAVTDKNEDGFGGNNAWWILIILFVLFGGWGGYGNNNANGVGAEVQRGFDTSSIISKLDGINSGICSLGYDQLAQMNGINANINQSANNIANGISTLGYAINSNQQALSSQLAQCCCAQERESLENRYLNAQNTCAITTAINQAAQSIMQNDNANYRQLHDENVAMQLAAKDDKIAEQASLIQALNLSQSQANQNQYLISELKKCPIPAYVVPNPATGCCGCGYSSYVA